MTNHPYYLLQFQKKPTIQNLRVAIFYANNGLTFGLQTLSPPSHVYI